MGADVTFARLYRRERLGDAELYIPASSLKGSLRSAASRVAAAYTVGRFTSCGQVDPALIAMAHRRTDGSFEECSVCRLFGSPGRTSSPNIFFEDLIPQGGSPAVITRVKLRDDALNAMKGGLYKSEVIWGVDFVGKIFYSDEVRELLPLLLLAFAELRMDRFGRRSAIDVRLEETSGLRDDLEPRWHGLLRGLEDWLWRGDV